VAEGLRLLAVTFENRGRNPLLIVSPLLIVTLDDTVRLLVTARVVPSKVKFDWAFAVVALVPFAVSTRFALALLTAVNPGPVYPVYPVYPVLPGFPFGPV
jgi:hypothetical protein